MKLDKIKLLMDNINAKILHSIKRVISKNNS